MLRKMGGCLIITQKFQKVKHVLYIYFLKIQDCEDGACYILVRVVFIFVGVKVLIFHQINLVITKNIW